MVEQKSKRDVLVDSRIAYIGDDTGLIKKVKVIAKRIEETQIVAYGLPRTDRPDRRRKIEIDGKEQVIERTPRPGALTAADNQKYVKQETELTFKLLGKYGSQVADQGIQQIGWASQNQISYVRGSDNIVQVFDTINESVLKQREYKDIGPIRGLHSITQAKVGLPHVIVDSKGVMIVDDLFAKQTTNKQIQMKGSHVHKSYLADCSLAVLSKGHPLQVWDVNTQKQTYQAKNVQNDELDLQTPIFDTGLTYIDADHQIVAVSTGYGYVRHYDIRVGKKCRSNDQVLKNEMMITHIVRSLVNENHLYAITQQGHPVMLDRRFNCRTIRTMHGAKGTARDCKIFGVQNGQEFLMTVGCDRYLRVFDASKELQKDTQCGSAFLKQKLNCILLSEPQSQ